MDYLASSLLTKKGGVLVAVVDSGVSAEHPLFKNKIASGGYDHAWGSSDTEDCSENGHGTHVAGIIADSTRALPNIKILPEKVQAGGIILPIWVANGVKHAVKHGAKVINISIGGRSSDWQTGLIKLRTVSDAVEYAVNNGVTVVVSAGNEATDTANRTPANCEDAIVVGAVNEAKERWVVNSGEASNTGSTVDLAAPGVNVESCAKSGETKTLSGTSMAAPHITAAAAMIKLRHPEYSPSEIEQMLKDCASLPDGSSGRNDEFGYGIPNLSLIAGSGDDSPIQHDGITGTCLWTLSENGALTLSPASGEVGAIPEWDGDADDLDEETLRVWPWTAYSSEITSVEVKGTIKLTGVCEYMFSNWRNLTTCNLRGLDVSDVCEMSYWFSCCESLECLHLPDFDATHLDYIGPMYTHCYSLTEITVGPSYKLAEVPRASQSGEDMSSSLWEDLYTGEKRTWADQMATERSSFTTYRWVG